VSEREGVYALARQSRPDSGLSSQVKVLKMFAGCRVSGFDRGENALALRRHSEHLVKGFGFGVWGLLFRVWG